MKEGREHKGKRGMEVGGKKRIREVKKMEEKGGGKRCRRDIGKKRKKGRKRVEEEKREERVRKGNGRSKKGWRKEITRVGGKELIEGGWETEEREGGREDGGKRGMKGGRERGGTTSTFQHKPSHLGGRTWLGVGQVTLR